MTTGEVCESYSTSSVRRDRFAEETSLVIEIANDAILEWGPHALAIAPDRLRQQVIEELDRARAQYA